MTTKTHKFRSRWWYALPIVLQVFGGIISWLALNKDDKKLAKNCFLLGIILTVAWIFLISAISITTDNLSVSSDLGSIFGNNDLDVKFTIEYP